MTFKAVSHDSIMLYFKQGISEEVLDEVQSLYLKIKKLEGIIDLTPSYCSILIQYDIFLYDEEKLKEKIIQISLETDMASRTTNNKSIKIPTNYKKNLDLERVANHNKLSIEEVINFHTQTTYRVYAIGFMLGFAYLASVNPKIKTARLKSPRKKVPKGSVALADTQTAIYPQDSAGGWNIIGHTEFDGFEKFCIGDRVQFVQL